MSVYSPVYSGTSIGETRACTCVCVCVYVYARCTRGATWKSWLKLAGVLRRAKLFN